VVVLSFTAWIRLFQGYFAEALARSREALDRARDLVNPYNLAFSLHVNCLFNQVAGDWHTVQERSALLVSLAAEQGFPHLVATGTFFQGWAAFASGETEAGITRMHQGLAAKRAGGAEIKVPYYLGVLADAYRQVGRATDALPLLTDALDRVEQTGERWFEAELHRLNAEVLIALGSLQDSAIEAEALLHRSLAVARAQGAHLWELRASMSLAQLLRDQGRREEARDLLAPICAWFSESLDAPNVKTAGALLDALN
jgi:predicted ATPase